MTLPFKDYVLINLHSRVEMSGIAQKYSPQRQVNISELYPTFLHKNEDLFIHNLLRSTSGKYF